MLWNFGTADNYLPDLFIDFENKTSVKEIIQLVTSVFPQCKIMKKNAYDYYVEMHERLQETSNLTAYQAKVLLDDAKRQRDRVENNILLQLTYNGHVTFLKVINRGITVYGKSDEVAPCSINIAFCIFRIGGESIIKTSDYKSRKSKEM
tara:strand:+ start:274 stop:720 length:447 start_codon:yes stop_codon:yes gene_type:complete